MFLMSEACRALAAADLVPWRWRDVSILLVSFAWDPASDTAESLAGRRLAAALLDSGARLHVLCAQAARDEARHPHYAVSVVPPVPFPRNKARRALQMLRSTVPEAEGSWVPAATATGRAILAGMPAHTIIYGRAMPGTSNVVAWQLARATRRPFVAHFSDEWPPRQVLAGARRWMAPYKLPLFERWRRRIIGDAAALTFTNPFQAAAMKLPLRRQAQEAFVVTHLASPRSVPPAPPQYDRFHIVHTGNFYPPRHTSASLLHGLRLFLDRTPEADGRVTFTQAGWCNGDVPYWTAQWRLGDVVRLAGRLDERDVLALLDRASLLVGVDYARPDSCTVLSKLPDYLAARRPMLALAAESSAMGRLFIDDGAGLLAHYDAPEQVASCIGHVFDAWRQGRSDPFLPHPAAVASFSRPRVLAELAGAFLVAQRAGSGLRLTPPSPARATVPPDEVAYEVGP